MSNTQSTSSANRDSSTSGVTTRKSDQKQKIDLIGATSHQITGAKLPSNRQVLQVMFYNIRFVGLNARPGAKLAVNAAEVYWHQARIPIRGEQKCIDKLMKLYENWKVIQKTVPEKRSNAQKQSAETFVSSLDDLFDIAAANALETIKIEEDKMFLTMQREKGRPGCMAGVDMTLFGKEKRSHERRERAQSYKRKQEEQTSRQFGNMSLIWFIFVRLIHHLPFD